MKQALRPVLRCLTAAALLFALLPPGAQAQKYPESPDQNDRAGAARQRHRSHRPHHRPQMSERLGVPVVVETARAQPLPSAPTWWRNPRLTATPC